METCEIEDKHNKVYRDTKQKLTRGEYACHVQELDCIREQVRKKL